jgi:pimeloyl-ACP methyl ester carboxylesterase
MERFVAAADGLRLHLVCYGEASGRTPVLCVPGLTQNNKVFERVAPALASDRPVATLSLRGRGRSGRDATGVSYSLDRYVDDVLVVLDELEWEQAVLLGTSLGGLTSMWTTWRAPERVSALVLNDIGPELQEEGLRRIAAYARNVVPVNTWTEAAAQAKEVGAIVFPDYTDDEWMEAARQRYVETGDGHIVLDYDPAIASGRLPGDDPWLVFAACSDKPLLLIRGALTDLLAPATVELMRAVAPALEYVEVPTRGHAPTLTEAVAADALRAFVAKF